MVLAAALEIEYDFTALCFVFERYGDRLVAYPRQRRLRLYMLLPSTQSYGAVVFSIAKS